MGKGLMIGTIVGVILILLIAGFFILTNNKNDSSNEITSPDEKDINEMVDCGKADNPGCFINRMNGCLPVTVKMVGTDGSTEIDLTILGLENETCHFQRKINTVLDLDCYFPKGTMNSDTLDQTFGNDKGLQQVVDDACNSGW